MSPLDLVPLESTPSPVASQRPASLATLRPATEAARPAEKKKNGSVTPLAVTAIVAGALAMSMCGGVIAFFAWRLVGEKPEMAAAPAELSPASGAGSSDTTVTPTGIPVQAVSTQDGDADLPAQSAAIVPVAASDTPDTASRSASTRESSRQSSTASNDSKGAIRPAPSSPASEQDTLERLKATTVFISVTTTAGKQSGSGFLLEKAGTRGVVVTNAHVVTPARGTLRRIECVFHSGTRSEFAITANINGKDDSADLAVMTIEHPNLPEPLNATQDVALRETLPVLVLGFPFGEVLATSSRRPSISVSRGTLSSIRRDEHDNVVLLQIDGGVNPGNSGGPLVTEDGNLVGIAVAKVRSADIGFAIPRLVLSELLLGRVAKVAIRELSRNKESTQYRVNVELIDPKQNIASVEILAFTEANVTIKKPDSDGRWQRASDQIVQQELKMAGLTAAADLALPAEASKWQFQIRRVGKDGSERYTQPAPLGGSIAASPSSSIASTPPPGDSRPPPGDSGTPLPGDSGTPPPSDGTPSAGEAELQLIKLPAAYSEVDVAAGGKYLILSLPSVRKLAVLDLSERKVVKYLDVAGQGLCTAGADKLVFVLPSQNLIQRWDLGTFQRELVVPLRLEYQPSVLVMGSASNGPILIGGGQDKAQARHGFHLLDLNTLKPTALTEEGQPLGRFEVFDGTRVRASADGRVFTAWRTHVSPSGFMVLIVDGTQVESMYKHETPGYIAPSADGSMLFTSIAVYTPQYKLIGLNEEHGARTFPVPAVQGNFYVRIERTDERDRQRMKKPPSLSVHAVGFDGPLVKLPQISMPGGEYSDFFAREQIALDQRIYFVPDAKVIATLPATNDTVVLREFDLLGELDILGVEYLFVQSNPPRRATVGVPLEYQMRVASKRGDIHYKLETGPERMKISKEGKLTWTPTARDSTPQSVVILVSDASGREQFHTFQIEVVPSQPMRKLVK